MTIMKLSIEQMTGLLNRANQLPHNTASDVFLTAASMAEAIENMSNGTAVSAPVKQQRFRDPNKPMLTVRSLRDLGLNYSSVAECAHDLVVTKGMSSEQAAKRMGANLKQVRVGLMNWKRQQDRHAEMLRRLANEERKV
jgi:hypothetical protein